MEQRVKNLIAFCDGINQKKGGKDWYNKHQADIDMVTPKDVFFVMNEQLKNGVSADEMLTYVDKVINVFFERLDAYDWQKPKDGFLYYLIRENQALLNILEQFKVVLKAQDTKEIKLKGKVFLNDLGDYNVHLKKLENILFPYMEKKMARYEGLKVMWALHDKVRKSLKVATALLSDDKADDKALNRALGQLYFLYYGMVQKQELIMFPAATTSLTDDEFAAMHVQSFDFDFAYIQKPKMPDVEINNRQPKLEADVVFKTKTGSLTHKQVEVMINTLPVDVTFVNEYDKVAFFSCPKDRIFPRTAAVVGRDVRNCHPPQSVHIVEKILSDFKEGIKDSENFWIKMKGMIILIQYFAMRDDEGTYMGTLEVSQEVSEIKNLAGEKRLLDD